MNRLLVLRLSALGDVIHTLPAVAALRDTLPSTQISWAVEQPYADLVETVGRVAAVPLRMKTWGKRPLASRRDIAAALRTLRGADAALDFQGLMKSALVGWLSRAPLRIGFASAAIREKPALLFTNRRIAVDLSRHVVEQNLELARGAAALLAPSTSFAEPVLDWTPFLEPVRVPDGEGSVVLLPGAGKANKLWPAGSFRALAKQIGPAALAVWGPGERELAEAIGARVAPPTSLRQLAWLLSKARVVIGADTGPLHLAAALGTPVIGLYGPTDPRRNGPYRQLHRCVSRFESTKLMQTISVEEVVNLYRQVTAQ